MTINKTVKIRAKNKTVKIREGASIHSLIFPRQNFIYVVGACSGFYSDIA